MTNPHLTPVHNDLPATKPQWAIDEVPKPCPHKMPYFPDHPDVKLRKSGKHPEQQGQLKARFKETVKKREPKKVEQVGWWRRFWKGKIN